MIPDPALPACAPAVTLMRPFNGIGDWLFCLAVLKYVNRQRPEVKVFVDYSRVRAQHAGHPYNLPAIVPQLYADSDVRFEVGPGPAHSSTTHDSLVYRKWPPELYIESTVEHLNDQTGLGIRYEPGVYPTFRAAEGVQRGDYVVMISHGKRRKRRGKEWGRDNLAELSRRLHGRGVRIVQVGAAIDSGLPGASSHYLGPPAWQLVKILAGARAYVGLENGIMVLAGFLGVPQVTIYDGASHPTRTNFEGQAKLVERIEAPDAAQRIYEWLQTGKL